MKSSIPSLLGIAIFAALQSSAATAQEGPKTVEQKVEAFSVWKADGRVLQSGENLVTFVGRLGGPFFVKTEKGPVLAGVLVCSGLLDIETDSGIQKANGHCSITSDKGEWTAFGQWGCSGVANIGCDGRLELTGGLGRLAGVSGGGDMTFRSGLHKLEVSRDGTELHRESVGIVFWDELRYSIPTANGGTAQ